MPNSPIGADIKKARFVDALVKNNGNATAAYKEVAPGVTEDSARQLGYRALKTLNSVHNLNIQGVLNEIGATPKAVLGAAWESAVKSKKTSDKVNVARLLAKIGAWDQNKDVFAGITSNIDTEVIDIVRVRLKKARKKPDDVIDIKADNAEVVDIKQDTQS